MCQKEQESAGANEQIQKYRISLRHFSPGRMRKLRLHRKVQSMSEAGENVDMDNR